jgi:hypothetical protein|tara:strand:+ start:103 stop:309 length:207 start_codon:yes stop_codon:yes gene_type:complete
MILGFLLVVLVNNEVVSNDAMLFRSIERCIYFARAVERSDYKYRQYYQKNVVAYCIPKMATTEDRYYD